MSVRTFAKRSSDGSPPHTRRKFGILRRAACISTRFTSAHAEKMSRSTARRIFDTAVRFTSAHAEKMTALLLVFAEIFKRRFTSAHAEKIISRSKNNAGLAMAVHLRTRGENDHGPTLQKVSNAADGSPPHTRRK